MKKSNTLILGIIFLVFGICIIFGVINLVKISELILSLGINIIFSIMAIIVGLILISFYFGRKNRKK